uniref:JmjC domain-containing protein n=1 Tax=Guillardia theta TaxID=55529 RepID=A0A7S4K5J7_GUITH
MVKTVTMEGEPERKRARHGDEEEREALEEDVNPYGIKPEGNLFDCDVAMENKLTASLGMFRRLHDKTILHILSFLDHHALCRLSSVSVGMYCFSHHTNIWRELTISKFGGDFRFQKCWKETFLKRINSKFPGHKPLRMKDCYSDILFEPWMNANMAIDPSWLTVENVDRRSGLTAQEFVENYEKRNLPVILTDVIPKWPASESWKCENLLKKYADTKFRVSATMDMKLEDFLDYCNHAREERPLYLFEKNFATKCPDMAQEYSIPPQFDEDLMRVLGEDKRPDYRWLIIGPERSGSSFHVDPNYNFAWNATIQGRKKWILYPPHIMPPGVMPQGSDGAQQQQEISLLQWFVKYYHEEDDSSNKRLECVTKAGELMYVPRGWWHCVLNLEPCVALTHNVVTQQNLPLVLDFFSQATPCEAGKGCRGSDGDVPTSVIFPYQDQKGGGVVYGSCRCMSRKLRLLEALEEGLAPVVPAKMAEWKEKKSNKNKEDSKASLWTNLVESSTSTSSFSFGF